MPPTPLSKQPWYVETIVDVVIAGVIFILRVFARTRAVGFRGWQGDDYLILITMGCYIAAFYCLLGTARYGFNTVVTDAVTAHLPDAVIDKIVVGSKMNFVNWIMYTTFLWSLKGCMLFLYDRLTMGLSQRRLVKATAVLCGVSYVVCILTITCHCRPISHNWQVRPRPTDCVPMYPNFYAVGISNFLTDGLLVSIPAPLLFASKITIRKKLLFAFLLCSGVFIMIATALRTILGLTTLYKNGGKNIGPSVIIWSTREMLVALVVVNLPCIKPLFSSVATGSCCCFGVWRSSPARVPGSGRLSLGGPSIEHHQHQAPRFSHDNRHNKQGVSNDSASTEDTVPKLQSNNFFERVRLKALGFTDTLFSVRAVDGSGSGGGSKGLYSAGLTMTTIKSKSGDNDHEIIIRESEEGTGGITENGSSAIIITRPDPVQRNNSHYAYSDDDGVSKDSRDDDVDRVREAEEGTYGGLSARRA